MRYITPELAQEVSRLGGQFLEKMVENEPYLLVAKTGEEDTSIYESVSASYDMPRDVVVPFPYFSVQILVETQKKGKSKNESI